MRQAFAILLGCIALVVGLYLSINSANAAQQSVMEPYVATPDDVARARALTKQFYAQKVPPVAMRTSPQQSAIRPSAWPLIKHDNPQSLGDGYVMQLVHPRPGMSCAVVSDHQKAITSVDCGPHRPGE